MKRERYDVLMKEMENIASKVKLFPESIQERAFELLVAELKRWTQIAEDPGLSDSTKLDEIIQREAEDQRATDEAGLIALIKRHASEYRLGEKTHPEFATYAAYVYSELAPESMALDEIGKGELENVYRVAGRKPPVSLSNQLNAAKKDLTYLTTGSARASFKLSTHGRYFVEHELLVQE